jgi:aspartyl-tRNA(Asn)/glutamyl-tRNA(Gln) amidotransferase subunit A
MHNKTLSELSALLHNGDITSVELTQHFLNRIKTHNGNLNAFISVTEESALAQAAAADKQFADKTAGKLTGIPMAHKDIFCTKGVRTSCASKMLDKFVAPYDATVVEKIAASGMVMLGKTNMDEFAMGSSNETSFYGPVKNPWDTERVPGGSSGGSAAAIAARLAPAATGTDTGGSIRQPSSLCNLTGLKPTYGRVSRYGMIAFASSLDQAGPMTANAEDAALLLNVMSGFDERDSTSVERDVPDYTANLNDSLQGLRIGLPKELMSPLRNSKSSGQPSKRSACQIPLWRYQLIMWLPLQNAHPICLVWTACALAIAVKIQKIYWICTNVHAVKVSVTKLNVAS